MINKKPSYKRIHTMLPALLFIFTFHTAVVPERALAFESGPQTPRKAAPSSTSVVAAQDDFDRIFREARDLIDKEEWAKAAEKFKEAVGKYPTNKQADAALYWLAFTYKKQKAFKQA